jgi:ribonucleoside-diphosphate reductase alpha chain
MDVSQRILSDLIVWMKYARYLSEKNRREVWNEIVDRNKSMHIQKFPELIEEIQNAYELVYDRKILPSMRSMQFAGKPIEINPARMYNCSYQPIDDYRAFSEGMFLLLSGVGYGYSVQTHHVEKLPEIKKPTKERRYLIGDSIEGWSDAVKTLMKSYLIGTSKPIFDFSDIRQKGMRLITSGGKAPGPEPLKKCLFEIQLILDRKESGSKLTSLECHDIMCHIADAVLAGGIRRSAMISLFSIDDDEMVSCKYGNWWEMNPQRGRSNNSAVVLASRISEAEFSDIWEKIHFSNSGEPGLYFTNDVEYGTNPCCETSLRPHTFCNLVEIDGSDITNLPDFINRCIAAARINTLQASYTNFHYLRDVWKRNTEKDALIGVGITGIASNCIDIDWLKVGAEIIKKENARMAKLLGIKPAARCTVIKPSGTTSCILGTSSGIHAWHNDYYIRRIRVGKSESIYPFLQIYVPEIIEDEYFRPNDTAVVSVPQRAPNGSILRNEATLDFLSRIKEYNVNWVRTGHRTGPNYHNVSATVSIKDDEWDVVGNWIWENRNTFHGISVLPFDGGSYKQSPFEDCSEEQYHELIEKLHELDLTRVIELQDETNLQSELACSGNQCEII